MATAALGAAYSPPSPLELHYADTTSSIFPDRPIRPLPKRRLRSRLSPEVADSILYPPATTSSKPLYQFPYKEPVNYVNGSTSQEDPSENQLGLEQGRKHGGEMENESYQFRGNEIGSDEEYSTGVARRHQEQRHRSSAAASSRNGHISLRKDANKSTKSPILQSTASSNDSIDGYDSFENTNNKKKRKIPTSGSLGNHNSTLSAEMAQMGISSARDIDVSQGESDGGVGQYYGSGNSAVPAVTSGTGISGAGRGRYGRAGTRHHNGRSPLGVSVNGSNALQAGRHIYPRRDYASNGSLAGKEAVSAKTSDQGIISAAIASAAALPAATATGQETVSLLEQQPSKKPSSTKTQFTFSCESDSTKGVVWPGVQSPSPSGPYQASPPNVSLSHQSQSGRGFATQGTQTSPKMAGQPGQTHSQEAGGNQKASQQAKKPRRPLVKQYTNAARDRRLRQEYSNFHHPPKEDDIWICEFCEYESIFGAPPEALIRQYEAKDRRERKRIAEKRRLLEKAKMKGKKGKKGTKNAAKNASASAATQVQQPVQKHRPDQQPMDQVSMQHQGTQSEDYILDDVDDEPIPMPALPAQTPSKIPQPVAQTHNQSLRPSSGTRMAGSAGRAA